MDSSRQGRDAGPLASFCIMAGSRRSAVGEGASASSGIAKDRWLSRQPLPAVAHAAQTQQWQGAIHWALGEALQAVGEGGVATNYLDLTMFEGGPSMRDWLSCAVTYGIVFPWDRQASSIVANAYERTLVAQRECRGAEKKAIARIARCMRDVVVLVVVSDAGGHGNQAAFKQALSEAFGHQLGKDMSAQLEHSYHHVFHGVQGAFVSGWKQLRPARVRRRADESASDVEGETYDLAESIQYVAESVQRRADLAESVQYAAESVQREVDVTEGVQYADSVVGALPPTTDPIWESAGGGVAELRRVLEMESVQIRKAVERAQAERGRLDVELRAMRGALEGKQADRVRLAALSERESELEIGPILIPYTAFGLPDLMCVWRHEAPPVKEECANPGAQPPLGAADAGPHPREAHGALCDGIARAATAGPARTAHGPAGSHDVQKKWHGCLQGRRPVACSCPLLPHVAIDRAEGVDRPTRGGRGRGQTARRQASLASFAGVPEGGRRRHRHRHPRDLRSAIGAWLGVCRGSRAAAPRS